jgi:hypothetical protein
MACTEITCFLEICTEMYVKISAPFMRHPEAAIHRVKQARSCASPVSGGISLHHMSGAAVHKYFVA